MDDLPALVDVVPMFDERVADGLLRVGGARTELRQAVNHVLDEMEAVHLVQYNHVERRRRGAFLLVTADVEVLVVRAAVGKAMDEPRVTMEGEDDRFVLREQRVEVVIAQAVRMFARRLELHQVHDIDDAHLQLRACAGE